MARAGGDLPDDAVRCFIYSVTYDGNLGIFYIQKKKEKKKERKKNDYACLASTPFIRKKKKFLFKNIGPWAISGLILRGHRRQIGNVD